MQADELLALVTTELDDRKAENIVTINVIGKSSFTDYMVITTGTSTRHIKALCNYVSLALKSKGVFPKGIEGGQDSEWVLVDLGDVILHVMTAQTREFYQLEKLWTIKNTEDEDDHDFKEEE
jgi:ribosome-associated protein